VRRQRWESLRDTSTMTDLLMPSRKTGELRRCGDDIPL
jgi:hypothetical protein